MGAAYSGASGIITQFVDAARRPFATKRTAPQFLEAYKTLPWYRAAVGRIADSISFVDWLALTEDPETEQLVPVSDIMGQKHSLEIFFDQPHPYFSWQTIVYIWTIWMKGNGEAFGIWDDNPEGRQIWPVKPENVTKLPTPEEPWFVLSLSNGNHEVPVNEMLWLLDPDPTAIYSRGSGIAESLDDELSTDEAAAKTVRGFFENQARPDILITGKGLNPEKTKKIEEEWREKQSGFWNAFKPHFMSEQVDIREFKQDFQSMQFIELRKYERDTIIQAIGVPPEIMNIVENSNRATIDAADYLFSKYTLNPFLRKLRDAFQKQLVPKFDDTGLIEIDYISPVQEDQQFNAEVMRFAPYAFLVDEVRDMANKEPLPDGKGETLPTPLNIQFTPINEEEEEQEPAPIPGETIEPEQPAPGEPAPAPDNTAPATVPLMPAAPTASTRPTKPKGRRVRTGRGYIVKLKTRRY